MLSFLRHAAASAYHRQTRAEQQLNFKPARTITTITTHPAHTYCAPDILFAIFRRAQAYKKDQLVEFVPFYMFASSTSGDA